MVKQEEILALCKSKGVGFSLTYTESDDSWWGSINSPAVSESLITPKCSYEITLLILKAHLDGL